MIQLPPVDPSEFMEIINELKRLPIEKNVDRKNVGIGRSQCFGIVSKRSSPPDLSRQSWRRAYLHHLLMEYAKKHIQIPFTSIQVNQNMMCAEHLDKHNIGLSYIVGFGDYTEGELIVSGDTHDIRHHPLLFDGSQMLHKTEPWHGERFSLVFHTMNHPHRPPLDVYEAFEDTDNKWKIKDKRTGKVYWGKNGLEHPLKKSKSL